MSSTAELLQFPKGQVVKADLSDGYTRTANQIQDALCEVELTGRQHRIINKIIRLTYGFQRKTKRMTADYLASAINYQSCPKNIGKDLTQMKKRKILVEVDGEIGVNSVVSEWAMGKNEGGQKQRSNTSKTTPKAVRQKQRICTSKTTPEGVENDVKESQKLPPIKENTKEKLIKERKKRDLDLSSLPEWLPQNLISDFIEHRKSIKSPITQNALKLLINKLSKFRDAGHDPIECLEEAIMNGWKGVFEPKGQSRKAQPHQTPNFSQTDYYAGAEGFEHV